MQRLYYAGNSIKEYFWVSLLLVFLAVFIYPQSSMEAGKDTAGKKQNEIEASMKVI